MKKYINLQQVKYISTKDNPSFMVALSGPAVINFDILCLTSTKHESCSLSHCCG